MLPHTTSAKVRAKPGNGFSGMPAAPYLTIQEPNPKDRRIGTALHNFVAIPRVDEQSTRNTVPMPVVRIEAKRSRRNRPDTARRQPRILEEEEEDEDEATRSSGVAIQG